MSNEPKKKKIVDSIEPKEASVEEEIVERVHPFDSFWQFQKQKQVDKEANPSKENRRPFWF